MLQTLERRRKYIGVILSDEHTPEVCSLYTNIPNKKGIKAVKQMLRKSKPNINIKVI